MNIIISSNNSLIREIQMLKTKKQRDKKKKFFIEGLRFVEEALNSRTKIKDVIISEKFNETTSSDLIIDRILKENYNINMVSDKIFKEISDTENPQGIMAILEYNHKNLDNIISEENNFIVILDCVQDPGNMGTIIRTADAAGVTGIVISKGSVDPYNPKVLRSTMGSIFNVPVAVVEDLEQALEILQIKKIKIFGAALEGTKNYFDINFEDNVAIAIGNEANGLSDSVKAIADELLKIPMIGNTESLNASVAAALLMYEVMRNKF